MSFNKLKDFEAQAEEAERQFVGTPDEPTPAEPPVEVQPESPVEPEVVAEQVESPKALIDEDKYKAAVKAMNEAQREAADLRKTHAELKKHQDEQEERLNELVKQSKRPAPVEYEDDLESDMPEVAKIAQKYAEKAEARIREKLEELDKRQSEWDKTLRQRETESTQQKLRQAVLAAHPDFDDVVNSDAMVAWVNNEAPPIFKAIYDGSVPFGERDVIAVVSQFKSTLAPKQQAHSKPNAADIAAPVRTSPVINTNASEDRVITEAELNDFMHNAQRKTPAEMDDFNRRLDKAYGK